MKIDIQVDVGQGWQFLAPGDNSVNSLLYGVTNPPESPSVHREGNQEARQANTSQLGPRVTSVLLSITRRGTAHSGWEPQTLEITGRC